MHRFAKLLATATAVAGLLAVAGPTLAYTETKTTGTVGAFSITDTKTVPGAHCSVKAKGGDFKLVRIDVNPPSMKAVPGHGTEKVGWNFTVQRKDFHSGTPTAWLHRYTSPTFTAATDSSHFATFTTQGVKVIVPYADAAPDYSEYRAILTMVWYEADGTTPLGTMKGRIDWYREDHSIDTSASKYCNGWV